MLLVSESQVKLADFGFSTQLKEPMEKLDTFCGSPPYAAPELFTEDHYIGQFVDIWALGVLLYFMVVGNMPFRAPTVPALRTAVLKGDFLLPSSISAPCSRVIRKCFCDLDEFEEMSNYSPPSFVSLVLERILVQAPQNRPTLDDLACSQWMGLREGYFAREPAGRAVKLSRFWKRGSTSRGSSARRRAEDVIPISCSTKRSESVLDETYLFPVAVAMTAVGESAGAAVGDLNAGSAKKKKSIFSLGLKTRIGPMDAKVDSQQMHNNGSVYVTDQPGGVGGLEQEKKKHSGSSTTMVAVNGSKDFEMVPTFGPADVQHPVEQETLRTLHNWGITDEMLLQAVESGARNELIGIYRIVVHRLQVQAERQRISSSTNTKEGGADGKRGALLGEGGTRGMRELRSRGSSIRAKCPRKSSNCNIL